MAALERQHVVYALHKPAGYVSTAKDTHGRRTVVELVASPSAGSIPSAGSTRTRPGLLLLTNDGELAELLTHPRHEVEKVYRASGARRRP